MKAPLPSNEEERLAALRSFAILDSEPEAEFDDLAKVAPYVCGTPTARISLVDDDRQWFKARVGMKRKVRDDKDYWSSVEDYLDQHAGVKITHGMCPSCASEMVKDAAKP